MKPVTAVLVGLLLLVAAPAQAFERDGHVARASHHSSVWHRPYRGFIVVDAQQMQSVRVVPRREALHRCSTADCRRATVARYHHLFRSWLSLNRSLWRLHSSLPACGNDFERDCVDGPAVHLAGRWFVAQQRARFTS